MTQPQFTSGAVDLAALAQQAEARKELAESEFEPFIEVTERDVEAKAFERSTQIPVVLMVGTARSPESEQLKATLASLAAGQREFLVAYVNADAHPQLAQALGVRALPTVVALAAGRPVTNFEGNQPAEQLTQWLQALVQNIGPQLSGLAEESSEGEPETDPRLAQAEAAVQAGDYDAAIAVYGEMLAQDPANAEVKQAKATVAVLKRFNPQARTSDAIADAAADPTDMAKQLDAADAEVLAGNPEAAFERLLGHVKTSSEAKDRLLELLLLFDANDPLIKRTRTNLASALF
ncbi:tetratricopeptide repeat protein [Corynebacterium sp. HMSC29G08]|uniref:tetratricopeptide repeat protein n=1 Tax=Corynebacterium sp. HMSC29G08 TaxID=1581069 RepID=UPI0008A5FB9A|nr:tetratricopeptide repeat protein [Corynebacterium sp. HMSC29G08]OFT82666.1 co-chaperone YbbN [Corynebacterium sp. HMSC29G08]